LTNDAVIESGYQTLFDIYPNCNIIDYAAMRLSQINLDKSNSVTCRKNKLPLTSLPNTIYPLIEYGIIEF